MEVVSAWRQALAAAEACLAAGVAEFVVCGGARNAALLEALARAEQAGGIRVWHHFEERGAGFFALGRTMATGQPCAVVTTSGTAAAELLPAVIEASYQARPLLVVTADRPERFRHSGAPQTIVQPGLFGGYAAVAGFAAWDGRGPLHLNVELEEDLDCGASPAEWRIGGFAPRYDRPVVAGLARWLRQDRHRGLAVMVGGLEPGEREEVFHFCHALGAPVVADAASGLREALGHLSLPDGDRLLAARPPGKILRLGELPSGRFWRDLEALPDTAVWSVCRNGLPGLARPAEVLLGPLERVLPALGEIEEVGDVLDLLSQRSSRQARMDELLEAWPDSEPALVRALSGFAALGSGVYLGNSLPVREWNLFAQTALPVAYVRANRGANGIDGQLSTWLGWSADAPDAWAVVGDLTALYDLAAGGFLPQVTTQGRRLVVINNQGGAIFSRLPRLSDLSARAASWLRNSHQADLGGFAKLWGVDYRRVRTADDFDAIPDGEAPLLIEIQPDPSQTAAFWQDWDRVQFRA
jgi:2-succinyl-5-enolpyruvyl-6-hydroxy-3-cyclohexene-1-carboxylate synthase